MFSQVPDGAFQTSRMVQTAHTQSVVDLHDDGLQIDAVTAMTFDCGDFQASTVLAFHRRETGDYLYVW